MSYLGEYQIDEVLTFYVNTHTAAGAASDADAVPPYRVYEEETGTAILTGNTAKLDDSNTVGFYSEQITLSAANGLEVGKRYAIYIAATVSSVVGTMHHTFQMRAAPALASAILDAAGIRSAVGLATANLDTQLGDLPTNAELATSQAAADDATLAAIAALNNLSAAQVNAEVDTAIADVGLTTTITGRIDAAVTTRASQTSVDDLPTNAELATSQAAADDATLAAIAALNNLSAAQVNSEVDTALADYDAPTFAELDARTDAIDAALAVIAVYVDTEVAATLAAVDTEVAAIKTVTDALTAAAAAKLALSASTIVVGNAAAGTLSTTGMTTDLTEATDDHYNGRIIIWTSGVLLGQATDITDYNGTTKTLTFTAITEAPTAGDDFIIV